MKGRDNRLYGVTGRLSMNSDQESAHLHVLTIPGRARGDVTKIAPDSTLDNVYVNEASITCGFERKEEPVEGPSPRPVSASTASRRRLRFLRDVVARAERSFAIPFPNRTPEMRGNESTDQAR